jgi:hypothetical protein
MEKEEEIKQVYYEGYFMSFKGYLEKQFENDLVLRNYSMKVIIEKVQQLSREDGILEIYQVNTLTREIKPVKIYHIFNELEIYNDFQN